MSEQASQQSSQGRAVAVFFGVVLGIAGLVWFVSSYAPSSGTPSTPRASSQPTTSAPIRPVSVKFTGDSQMATQRFTLQPGLARFEMEYTGPRVFAVWLLNDKGVKQELLANTDEDRFKGSKAVQIKQAGDYLLDVSASGPWTVSVQQTP